MRSEVREAHKGHRDDDLPFSRIRISAGFCCLVVTLLRAPWWRGFLYQHWKAMTEAIVR